MSPPNGPLKLGVFRSGPRSFVPCGGSTTVADSADGGPQQLRTQLTGVHNSCGSTTVVDSTGGGPHHLRTQLVGVHKSCGLDWRGSTTVADSADGGPQQLWTRLDQIRLGSV
eukprot:1193739-Prorocentrum_minimum.AAC.6